MKVKRIVANVQAPDLEAAQRFYRDVLGLELLTERDSTLTYGASERTTAQIGLVSAPESALTPELTVEVDDLDEALRRVKAAEIAVEYGPAAESWGVKRFYVRDPFGKLISIFEPAAPAASGYIRGNSRHDR